MDSNPHRELFVQEAQEILQGLSHCLGALEETPEDEPTLREVYRAMHGCGTYKGTRTFLDRDWIYRLSGLFSSLYFASLKAAL